MTLNEIKEYLFINYDNEELEDIINYLQETIEISRQLIKENQDN